MRDTRLDYLRVILIIAVICIHTFCVIGFDVHPEYRTASMIINTICHYSVPLFVMVSGIVFLNYKIPLLSAFYLKRVTRLIVPLGTFSVFFILLRILRDHDAVSLVFKETLIGFPYYHLWFGFMLIGVMLVIPLLQRIAQEVKARYSVPFCLLLIYVSFLKGEGPYLIIPYSAYALLGMIIYQHFNRKHSAVGWICFGGAVILTVFNCRLSVCSGGYGWMGYCSPIVCVGSLLLMIAFVSLVPTSRGGCGGLTKCVFGVYLAHPIFKGVSNAILVRLHGDCVAWMVFPMTVVLSFGAVWLLSKWRPLGIVLGTERFPK